MAHDGGAADEQALLNFGEPVDDADFCREMRARLYEQLRSTSAQHIFPGGQPVSFESRHLGVLEREDYYVCEKSDGVRYLLYFCRPPGGPLAFLIDRNYQFRCLGPLEHPTRDLAGSHEETLLDGELLVDTWPAAEAGGEPRKKTSFMVFDCLLINTRNVMQQSLPERLKHVQNDVIAPFAQAQLAASFPFDIQLKTMYKPYHMAHLFGEVIPKLPHGNDGLIFTPVEDPYQSGTCQRMLKWKPAHMNSVDFRLDRDAGGGLVLQVAQSGVHKTYCRFKAEEADAAAWAEAPPLGKILECRYDPAWLAPGEGGWRFLRFREDKLMANAQHVVQKIIHSIGDNVTQEQLVGACSRIKGNWEARHPDEARAKRPRA